MPLKFTLKPEPETVLVVDPALLAKFRAAQENFNYLLEQEHACCEQLAALKTRIEKGLAYCKQHPNDAAAMRLLMQLRREAAEVERELGRIRNQQDWEATLAADYEAEIRRQAGGRVYVCDVCWRVISTETWVEHQAECCPRGATQ